MAKHNTSLHFENQNLKDSASIMHQVNHCYRDVLHDVFARNAGNDSKEAIEQKTLKAACERIADFFNLLIKEKCTVTVKLMTKDEDGKSKCHTHARSESNSERDRVQVHFEIDTGENLAFDIARNYNPNGVSHFFSADLDADFKAGKYSNERTHWDKFYRSAIVVPIRYVNYEQIGLPNALNELGFLAVDTMATYKLNDEFHIQYLAGFADQMYNFMSLMRGRYCLPPGPGEGARPSVT